LRLVGAVAVEVVPALPILHRTLNR
jgi:hypothetical protein